MHPITNLVFFAAALGFSMFVMQPVCAALSLTCALANALYLGGKKTALFSLRFLLPAVILITIINPLINHRGATIIEYLPWGNPLTLESVVFGIISAVVLCSAALWFSCVNRVMTSDKLVYLFGKTAPSLGLLLSVSLRFVPHFAAELKQTAKAQKQLYNTDGASFVKRLKFSLRVLSVMITKSLEEAVDTSDSMKSRGYGLKGRTAYSIYSFTTSDKALTAVMIAEILILLTIIIFGGLGFRYFPSIKGNPASAGSIAFYTVYTAFLLTPLIINVGEGFRWKRSRSKI